MWFLARLGLIGLLLAPLLGTGMPTAEIASAATTSCQPTTPAPTDPYPGATVVADNFESDSLAPFIVQTAGTGTATVSSALAHTGGCAAYLHVTSDAGSLAYLTAPLPAGTPSAYADGWFNITTAGLTGSDVPYFRFFSGTTRIADVYRYNSNGQLWLRVTSPTGAFVYTRLLSSSIPLSSWHHVVMQIVPNTSATTIQVWFDSVLVYSSNQVSTGFTTLSTVQLGSEHTSQMGDSYVDDVIVKSGAQAAPVFTASTPPATATVGTAYSYTFAASGNPAPTFRVSSGALPAGLSLNSTTGVLSGTPTAAGPATFTVTATNGVSPDAVTPSITITVNPDTTAPTAPANLSAVAGAGQISLAWSASTDNVGVTRYNISRNGAPIGTAAGTSYVDGSVVAGTSYSYTVTAQDAAGNVSAPSNTATATAAGVRTITIDKLVTAHQSTNAATVSAAGLTTTGSNQLILAFISSDGPSGGGTESIRSVSGGGLTWTLRRRTNAQAGTAEIWQAVSPAPLTNVTISATQNSGSWQSAMTVVAFNNADTTNGATTGASAASGAPSASLTTTRAGSWVWGVGTDWDAARARTVGPAQTLVDQYFPPAGDTYWVQRQTGLTATSGTLVAINDTAPTTDRWNLAVIEILAAQ